MISCKKLINCIQSYDPHVDIQLISRAYTFAKESHKGQFRESGEPFFTHPIRVAQILAQMKMDSLTIAAGLLHDVLEDTHVTYRDLAQEFGENTANIVEGVTKISHMPFKNTQAENFRKFVFAIAGDIRVLFVKLSDRLHNMRTLEYLKDPEKRVKIAEETQEIYVPLASRIGLYSIYTELDDLVLKTINSSVFSLIQKKRQKLYEKSDVSIEKSMSILMDALQDQHAKIEMSGRLKFVSSIWNKMRKTSVSFEQLSDIMAFRILVPDVSDCYQILGKLHQVFRFVPGQFKDFISNPKGNNYQSLHTNLILSSIGPVEVQIRTHKMHEVAEFGIASHWYYKVGGNIGDNPSYTWVRNILDVIKSAQTPQQFLENAKLELYRDEVFCFTPKGDLICLKQGSTALDFAYAIHEDIGNKAVAAKINGKKVSLRTQLKDGMYIEIITDEDAQSRPVLLPYLKTRKARRDSVRDFMR